MYLYIECWYDKFERIIRGKFERVLHSNTTTLEHHYTRTPLHSNTTTIEHYVQIIQQYQGQDPCERQ